MINNKIIENKPGSKCGIKKPYYKYINTRKSP